MQLNNYKLIEIKGKSKVVEKNNKKYVIKDTNNSLEELFTYLESVNFKCFPKVISYEESFIRTRYVNENKIPISKKEIQLIQTVASLHNSTVFTKDVSKNKYKKIYNKLLGNVLSLKEYYEKLISNIELVVYPSPSQYLIMRNYSIINASLIYCEKEIDIWFDNVQNKTQERVCILHNNLSLNHFISGDKNYLISWDNFMVDTPILDLYKLYKNTLFKNFESMFNEYNNIFRLTDDEIRLFLILISIPNKIEDISDEYKNTLNIKKILDYIYNTNILVSSINLNIEKDKSTTESNK